MKKVKKIAMKCSMQDDGSVIVSIGFDTLLKVPKYFTVKRKKNGNISILEKRGNTEYTKHFHSMVGYSEWDLDRQCQMSIGSNMSEWLRIVAKAMEQYGVDIHS